MIAKETVYKLSLSGGDITVTDRQISEEKALKILTVIMGNGAEASYENRLSPPPQTSPVDAGSDTNYNNIPSPKIFMAQKKPSSEIERLTCLAYYLTHYSNVPTFKTRDLTKLGRQAAQQTFSNPAVFARNAVQAEYLALAGGGSKQITTLGEAVVDALPDRERVKAAIGEHRSNRKRRAKKNQRKNVG